MLVDREGDEVVLAGHGVGYEIERLHLGVGRAKIDDVHAVDIGPGLNEIQLAESAHSEQDLAKVGR